MCLRLTRYDVASVKRPGKEKTTHTRTAPAHLYSVVAAVGDINVAVLVCGDTRGRLELARLLRRRCTVRGIQTMHGASEFCRTSSTTSQSRSVSLLLDKTRNASTTDINPHTSVPQLPNDLSTVPSSAITLQRKEWRVRYVLFSTATLQTSQRSLASCARRAPNKHHSVPNQKQLAARDRSPHTEHGRRSCRSGSAYPPYLSQCRMAAVGFGQGGA